MDIALTARCPLRCRFCTVAKQPTPELDAAQWLAAIGGIAALRPIRLISLEGGEPFVRPDLARIARGALAHAAELKIVTGGSLPLEERLPRELLCDPRLTIEVSVDGPQPIHDELRDGSWEAAWAFIGDARRRGARLRLRTVVSELNREAVVAWLQALDRGFADGAAPVGFRFDTLIAPEALAPLGGPLPRHPLRGYASRGLIPTPEAVVGLFRRLHAERFRNLRVEQTEAFRGCGAGRIPFVSFDPAGGFSFCCEAPRGFGSILATGAPQLLALLDAQMAALPCRRCAHFAQNRCDGCWTGQKCGMTSAGGLTDCRALLDSAGAHHALARSGRTLRRHPEGAAAPPR
jgi:hypothetical protein